MFGESDGYVPPERSVPVSRAALARSGYRDTEIMVFKAASGALQALNSAVTRVSFPA